MVSLSAHQSLSCSVDSIPCRYYKNRTSNFEKLLVTMLHFYQSVYKLEQA